MNVAVLHKDVQAFIDANLNSNVSDLALKGIPFNTIDVKTIINQIQCKLKAKHKLPSWYSTNNIYYPEKLNLEQTSSEITANYKSNLVNGNRIIDLTGGFGVDAFAFSKHFNTVYHCEINSELSKIVKHNIKSLNVNNIECYNSDGLDVLNHLKLQFDVIYIDPSRRDDIKNKVFLLSDCSPNVVTHLKDYFKFSHQILIKTSPLLDITATLNALSYVKSICVLAVNNEVKELLWLLEYNYNNAVNINAVNIKGEHKTTFNFKFNEESLATASYSEPLQFIYEPNSAILKSGAFNSVSKKLNVYKLHKHTHLYTSEEIVDFPGRIFNLIKVIPFNKKAFQKERISKANITTRNFPLSVQDIRKKLKVKDGGELYLFFTTTINNEKCILICNKA